MPEETAPVVQDIICKAEDTQSFLIQFWEDHQEVVIGFGKSVVLTVLVILLAWIVSKILRKVIMRAVKKLPKVDDSIGKILYGIARTFVWIFAFLIVLDLFGINTASILTVLGAAGLAIGLAMKESLSNIAAGLMLLFLHPYKVGDYVECGSVSGTIEEMGLFTTTLKTFDGLFISAPNNVIFGAPVKNYSRNPLRMVNITVGIAYGDSLPKGLEILKEYLVQNEFIEKDPVPQVLVADLADSSVNLTLRFWTLKENYWKAYWSVKEGLKGTIESAGLNIPFPQRVITFANPLPQEDKKG